MMLLIDHVEIEHERELAPGWTAAEIEEMHRRLHLERDDWGHVHNWPPSGLVCTWGALNAYVDCGFGETQDEARGVFFCEIHAECVIQDEGIDADKMFRALCAQAQMEAERLTPSE